MKLTDMNYNKRKAYRTLQEAYDAIKEELSLGELSGEKMISLGISIDSDGVKWYAVGHENEFTNCLISNLQDLSWYEEGWIEKEKV